MFLIRRLLQICAVFAVCLAAACGNEEAPPPAADNHTPQSASASVLSPAADNGGDEKPTDEKPTYVVATQASYPPFSIRNADGSVTGLNIELLQAVAKVEGFNIQVLPHNVSGILDTLQRGQADIAAGIQMTTENQNTYLFSQPYLESGYGVLLPASSKISNIAELQGKTVAVTEGGSAEKQLRSNNLTDKILPVSTLYLALKEVKQEKAAAVYSTEAALKPYLLQYTDFVFVPDEKAGQIHFAFALDKRGTPLQNKINKGLNTIRANGTYQQIVSHWLDSAKALPHASATPAAR